MRHADIVRAPRPRAWLWWLAVLVALLATCFVLNLRQRLPDPDVRQAIHQIIAAGALVTGLCIISALAGRRNRR